MRQTLLSLLIAPALLLPSICAAQSAYPESLLNTKGIFTSDGAAALGQPFRGIATSDGVIEDLFPLQDTGLSTASLAEAGAAFLASLNDIHLSRAHFPVDDPEWRNWSMWMWVSSPATASAWKRWTQPRKRPHGTCFESHSARKA